MKRGFLIGAAVLLAASATPGVANAARGGDSVQPDCWWDPAVQSGCTDTTARSASAAGPAFGNLMTFTFESRYFDADGGTGPWLQLKCYRNGALILSEVRAGFAGGWGYGVPFELEGTSWFEGSADCVTELGHQSKGGRFRVDASTGFHVTA